MKVRRRDSLMLRLLNTTLALMTLLLIATAMSMMFLYIAVYGLSMRRLLPCIFMLFMAVLCAAIITAGPAGVTAAERLLAGSSERPLRIIARRYLDVQCYEASLAAGTARDTLQNMVIRQKLKPGNN